MRGLFLLLLFSFLKAKFYQIDQNYTTNDIYFFEASTLEKKELMGTFFNTFLASPVVGFDNDNMIFMTRDSGLSFHINRWNSEKRTVDVDILLDFLAWGINLNPGCKFDKNTGNALVLGGMINEDDEKVTTIWSVDLDTEKSEVIYQLDPKQGDPTSFCEFTIFPNENIAVLNNFMDNKIFGIDIEKKKIVFQIDDIDTQRMVYDEKQNLMKGVLFSYEGNKVHKLFDLSNQGNVTFDKYCELTFVDVFDLDQVSTIDKTERKLLVMYGMENNLYCINIDDGSFKTCVKGFDEYTQLLEFY